MRTPTAWLWGAAIGLPWALAACGGTGDVTIGDGGGESSRDQLSPGMDHLAPDAPSAEGTTPMDASDAGLDQTNPKDSGPDSTLPDGESGDSSFDAPFDSEPFDSSFDSPFDGEPFDSSFDGPFFDSPFDSPFDSGDCTTCVPPVPSGGWQGPEELYSGAGAPPACGTSFKSTPSYDGFASLDAPAAICSLCTCGSPTGVTCSSVAAEFFSDSSCSTACSSATTASLANGACTSVTADLSSCSATLGGPYLEISTPKADSGFCPPSKEIPAIIPLSWGTQAQACRPSGGTSGSCSGGAVCVPPSDPLYSNYCVHQKGDLACPGTGYPSKFLFYGGDVDSRSCTTCSCGGVSDEVCELSQVDAYSDSCLTETDVFTPLPEMCTSVPTGTTSLEYKVTITALPNSCTASGGTPKGAATPTEPTTFCCTP
jgi:hypothetical protein